MTDYVQTSRGEQLPEAGLSNGADSHESASSLILTGEQQLGQVVRSTPAPLVAPRSSVPPVIRIEKLAKIYEVGRNLVPALRGVSLTVQRGEFITIMGPSGSGKSTLMNLLGCLDRPTAGEYYLDGVRVSKLSKNQLADIRNLKVGFVFQGFNLLPRMSAQENVELPLTYSGMSGDERRARSQLALKIVGLEKRADHKPNELSGGQQQRVAIARSLVTRPSLLLADEPTGNLDSRTGLEIMMILQRLNARGITIILVTHDASVASFSRRLVRFRDGRMIEDVENPQQVLAIDELRKNGYLTKKVQP
jgi:putative ABC transport system ATP-binding protein